MAYSRGLKGLRAYGFKLASVPYALCSMPYALCSNGLCSMPYARCSMLSTLYYIDLL